MEKNLTLVARFDGKMRYYEVPEGVNIDQGTVVKLETRSMATDLQAFGRIAIEPKTIDTDSLNLYSPVMKVIATITENPISFDE